MRAYSKNVLGRGNGLRLDLAFSLPHLPPGTPPPFAVRTRDPAGTDAILRPLANLGFGPRVVQAAESHFLPPGKEGWLLLDAPDGRIFASGRHVYAVGADRVARPLSAEAGLPFLFAEGEILARLAEETGT
jgi:hypothetical protein